MRRNIIHRLWNAWLKKGHQNKSPQTSTTLPLRKMKPQRSIQWGFQQNQCFTDTRHPPVCVSVRRWYQGRKLKVYTHWHMNAHSFVLLFLWGPLFSFWSQSPFLNSKLRKQPNKTAWNAALKFSLYFISTSLDLIYLLPGNNPDLQEVGQSEFSPALLLILLLVWGNVVLRKIKVRACMGKQTRTIPPLPPWGQGQVCQNSDLHMGDT